MRITFLSLLVAFIATNSASAFVFPDAGKELSEFRPFKWIGDLFYGMNNKQRPSGQQQQQQNWADQPNRGQPSDKPFFYPPHPSLVAQRPYYVSNSNRYPQNDDFEADQQNKRAAKPYFYPPHPSLIAQRPFYAGNSNKYKENNFEPQDYRH